MTNYTTMTQFDSLKDIEGLIHGKIEESLILEYKRELGKKNSEVSKDISAFANTSGGVLIYGIEEDGRIPTLINWLEGKNIKEKIENIILSNIQPKIRNVIINSISNPENPSQGIFVVNIPESSDAPHMADFRYYRRYNFQSIPMEDYEVKDAMFRKGLKESLDFEIDKNIELCKLSLKLIDEIYRVEQKQRQHIVLIPFHSDAWKAIINSGLLFVLKKNTQNLVEIYRLIHEINYLVDCQKYGLEIVNTPIDKSKPEIGIYLPSILREKIGTLQGQLFKFQKNDT